MTNPSRLALGSAASLLLFACDPPNSVDPAANLAENVVINSDNQAIPQAEERREIDRNQMSGSADKELPMTEPTPPPSRPAPVPPPRRREILPSPIQPPAEVDPVHPDPGDEVPR